MNDKIYFRDLNAEKSLSNSITEVPNTEYGFIACGLSFDELIKELNNG